MKLYKIGEIAELLGLTTQALRFYEREQVIKPVKSENGTRYYSANDVHRLLAFKKYRAMDFSMQDIIDYMRNRPLDERSQWLKEKSEELLHQSETLYRRAQTLTYFRHKVEDAERNAGIFRECMRPDCVVHNAYLEEIKEFDPETLQDVRTYVDAMPISALCFTTDDPCLPTPRYRLAAEYEQALSWRFPLRNTFRLLPVRCVTTYIVCPSDFEIQPALARAWEDAKAQSFDLDEGQQTFCVLSTADTSTPVCRVFIQVFFPLR